MQFYKEVHGFFKCRKHTLTLNTLAQLLPTKPTNNITSYYYYIQQKN